MERPLQCHRPQATSEDLARVFAFEGYSHWHSLCMCMSVCACVCESFGSCVKTTTTSRTFCDAKTNVCLLRCSYYRSGTEMLRMANVYQNEGNHENAFILYMRYMTLFIEKIRSHPDYASVKVQVKSINKTIKDEIMPTTEKLRNKLLTQYQREYEQFLANKEALRVREMQREEANRRAAAAAAASGGGVPSLIPANLHVQMDSSNQPTAPELGLLDQVVYPNDFPTPSNRSNLPSSGLLLPGVDTSAGSSADRTSK